MMGLTEVCYKKVILYREAFTFGEDPFLRRTSGVYSLGKGPSTAAPPMSDIIATDRGLEKYGMTTQMERFAQEYVLHLDAGKAAVAAGYKHSAQTANRLLNHVGVATYISELLEERSLRTAITSDMVLRELAQLGLSSVSNYEIDDDGNVTVAEGVPVEALRAVKKIKRTVKYDRKGHKIVETELELWDKVAALNLAGKHLGMFIERHAHLIKGEVEHKQVWEFGGQKIEF